MFNKDIFKKKYDILELQNYDLTEELSILEEKNNKIDKIRNKIFLGFSLGIVVPSIIWGLSSLTRTNGASILSSFTIFLIPFVFILENKIPLLSSFKNINKKENEAIEKITLLCKEEKFQFELLDYLKNNISKLNSIKHNESAEFHAQISSLETIYNKLVKCFSYKEFLEASEVLTCRENLYLLIKINKRLKKIEEVKIDNVVEEYQLKFSGYVLNKNPSLEVEKEYEYKNYL